MSDFESFAAHWQECVNALYYRIRTAKEGMLRRESIDAMWREEIALRFFSQDVVHGAAAWLADYRQRCPEKGRRAEEMLRSCALGVGMEEGRLISGGAEVLGAGLGMLASLKGKNKTIKAVGAAASAALAAHGIKNAVDQISAANPAKLAEDAKSAAEEKLKAFRALLGE